MAETRTINFTGWHEMPVEKKQAIALEQPEIPIEHFVAILLQTITKESVHDNKATTLNEAMFQWTETQLERFRISAQPSADLQVIYPKEVYTQKLLLETLLDRLAEIQAIDTARYIEWTAKLPLLPPENNLI